MRRNQLLAVDYLHLDQSFSIMCLHQVSACRHYAFGYSPEDQMIICNVVSATDSAEKNSLYAMAIRYLSRAIGHHNPGHTTFFDQELFGHVDMIEPETLLSGRSKRAQKFWGELWDTMYPDLTDRNKRDYFKRMWSLALPLSDDAHRDQFRLRLASTRWYLC